MRIFAVIITLLIIGGEAFAQGNSDKPLKKMSYGLYFAPTLCYRHLDSEPSEEWLKDLRNQNEEVHLSFSAAFLMSHVLTEKFSLGFGLVYSDRGFQSTVDELTWVSTNTGFPTKTYTSFHYRYFDVPLNLKYYFYNKNKLQCYASVGLSLAMLFNHHKINHRSYDGRWIAAKEDKGYGYNRANLMGNVEVGMEYSILKALKINVSLFFQQAMLATTELPTKEYLFNSGLNIGIIYTPTNLK